MQSLSRKNQRIGRSLYGPQRVRAHLCGQSFAGTAFRFRQHNIDLRHPFQVKLLLVACLDRGDLLPLNPFLIIK